MRLIFLYLLLLSTLAASAQRPNIVYILADDLGYGDIGCYGQQKIETPNIDKLAKQGMKFTNFYSGSTVCAPSRVSLMTGLHTGHIPVRGNKGTKPEGQTPLPDSTVTIANLLQQQGYVTAAFGKWGLGYITTSGAPDKKGFAQFYGYNCQSLAHDYYPDHLWNNNERIDLSVNLNNDSIYSADLIHQQAIHFLETRDNKPFFAFLPYTLPHGDVIAPRDSIYNYYIKKFNEPPFAKQSSAYTSKDASFEPYPHAAFAAMVTRLDKYVGEVMATLKKKGLLENTLIIFTSDNGPHRENGGDPEFFNSNGIYRGIKRDLYDGGIRVPFIAYWKGKIKPAISAYTAASWDIYPTIQALAKMPVTKDIDGIAFNDVLLGAKKTSPHTYFYWEFHENNGRQAIKMGKWKAIKLNVSTDPNAAMELYDTEKDKGEQVNVAAAHPDIVKLLESYIQSAHVANKEWPLLPSEKK